MSRDCDGLVVLTSNFYVILCHNEMNVPPLAAEASQLHLSENISMTF